jgi:hypothetical protein
MEKTDGRRMTVIITIINITTVVIVINAAVIIMTSTLNI